ncbi:MAG: hypothetical protein SP1CHLAM54_16680 [Chlamydiia bacterium]|nr:hypothetical protein [Chlamydiia bacterium]MCH9616557.1 hypothetical protein [Chlamydiia bacterium]MCH9629287.1 hypothetical protein [Chlamydiia bacterium]
MSIKEMTKEELNVRSEELLAEIFELRSELSMARKLEKPHLLRAKKKERARILTALRSLAE